MDIKYINEFVEPSVIHEQLFVGYLWQTPQLYEKYRSHTITQETFTEDIWFFYYHIGNEMYNSGIRTFDDVTVYSFLSTKPKEVNKKTFVDSYNDFGGFEVIEEIKTECNKDKDNDEYHFSEMQKYECLRGFQKEGLIDVANKELVAKLTAMSLKQMRMYYQFKSKQIFSGINSGEVVEYNLIDNLYETIDELYLGEEAGIPLFDSPRLNKKINGWRKGSLMYLVLSSGVGKSSLATEKFLLALIQSGEKGLVFANEEGAKRWRSRLLTTVASRILHKPINRETVTRGSFNDYTKQTLKEAADWLYKNRRDMIKFFNLKKYRIEDVISRIEMYRPLNYSHVFFDTFKPDLSSTADRWLSFSNSAQELYDCIKEESNNCATLATVQLKIGKEYRYLDLDSIGKSLEIVEVAGIVLAGRRLFDDEYEGKHAIKAYNWEQDIDDKWSKKPYQLDPNKKYLILFIPKNREGSVDEQILFEINYAFNMWKEVAYCVVPKTSH